MGAALFLDHVNKSFDGIRAVSDLTLSVREGSLFGLLGPNGAGKTTAIRMVMSIILPDSGSVRVFDRPAGGAANRLIGYLPEERGLYRKMRVREMLGFLGELRGLEKATARSSIGRWLERLDLSGWSERRVEDLSKGMQQKLQFIASVLHDPPLLIFDEPFAGLDPINAGLIKEIIMELRNGGRTVMLSTHRMEQVEQLCDSIGLINKSRLVLAGDPKQIRRDYGKNTVIVDFEGASTDEIESWPGVLRCNGSGRFAEVKLKPDADSHEYLQFLVSRVRVNRFEVVEPSLEEIFIEKVKETDSTVGSPR